MSAAQELGELALGLIEAFEEEIGEASKVGTVAIVFELDNGDETMIGFRCSDERAWIQAGLFSAATRAANQK